MAAERFCPAAIHHRSCGPSPARSCRQPGSGYRLAALAALLGLVSACATRPTGDGPPDEVVEPPVTSVPVPAPVPGAEPRSRYGNGPIYQVFGTRYQVLPSSEGYRERGVASWYGREFHGKPTSSRETYDMHAMTAAHKTLPLPTWVEVRNLRNGKSVVVRVNDRGPFVANRIIDLSYAAARELEMIEDGTTLVEVTALARGEPRLAQSEPDPAPLPEVPSSIYVQVGAFGDADNARRRHSMLQDGGIAPAFVHEDASSSPALYRVRIGPIADVVEYDSIVERLQELGISETHLVTE